MRDRGEVSVSDLAAALAVAPITVRRDITVLANQGLLRRVHGGATLAEPQRSLPTEQRPRSLPKFRVGMVVPSMDFYWPEVVFGAQTSAAGHEGQVLVRASSYDAAEDRRQITRVLESGVQGLVLAPTVTDATGLNLLRWIAGLHIPTVLVERSSPVELGSAAVDSIATDHAHGAGLVLRHLVNQGHCCVGLFTSDSSPTAAAIRTGWHATAANLGVDLTGLPDVTAPPFTRPGWRSGIEGFLTTCLTTGTTAVLVNSDPEAIALLQAAEERGLVVPEDLSIVAFDDEVASISTPALTAVRPPKRYLGRLALELLLGRILEGPTRPVHSIRLQPELVLRESVAEPKR